METCVRCYLYVILFWAALFLPGLGEMELKGEEGRRILPAREMLRTGEWIVPFSEGRPYHRKPPALNWAIAGCFAATGVQNEWTARLPSVLGVLLLALACVKAGERLLGSHGGLSLALCHLFVLGFLEKGRLAELEALYVSLVGIGFLVWLVRWKENASGWALWLPTVLPLALAQLVKGPVFMVFFYAVVLACIATTRLTQRERKWSELWHPGHLMALGLSLAPLLIWGWLVKQRLAEMPHLSPLVETDPARASLVAGSAAANPPPSQVWMQQITERLSFDKIDWAEWLVLPFRSLLLFSPWVAWALVLWCFRSKRGAVLKAAQRPLMKGLWWGSLLSAAAFCLLPNTRARYLLPLLTPLLIWAVVILRGRFGKEARIGPLGQRVFQVLTCLIGLAAVSLTLYLPISTQLKTLTLFVDFVLMALCYITAQQGRMQTVFLLPCLLAAQIVMVAACSVIPHSRTKENVRPMAEALLPHLRLPGSIAAFNPGPQPMLFYLGKRCAEVSRLSQMPKDTDYVLIQPADWESAALRPKLKERGFTRQVAQIKDERSARQREYLLIERTVGVQ